MHGTVARTRKSWLAGLMAGLVLFAQLAMAAQACVLAQTAPGASQAAIAEAGCDGMPMDEAACLARCLMQDQAAASVDQHSQLIAAPAAMPAAAFVLPRARYSSPPPSASRLPCGPPLQILFCSYQI